MNVVDYMAAIALVKAIGVNSLLVYLQKTRHIYKPLKHGWRVHKIVISFFWGLFIASCFRIPMSDWRFEESYELFGGFCIILAGIVFTLAIREIGVQALTNGNFFGKPKRKLGGIYRILPETIYISYVIGLLGLGLITAQIGFFVLAILAAIGLIGIESRIENV